VVVWILFTALLFSLLFVGLDVGAFQQRWRIGRKWKNRHKNRALRKREVSHEVFEVSENASPSLVAWERLRRQGSGDGSTLSRQGSGNHPTTADPTQYGSGIPQLSSAPSAPAPHPHVTPAGNYVGSDDGDDGVNKTPDGYYKVDGRLTVPRNLGKSGFA
jgi:hypothetical protein